MRAYRVAYDGRPFRGFQRQPDVPTVEDAIFDALRALGVLEEAADRPAGYTAAGRTDAGVSARAQTVAFAAPDWLSPAALNSELPASIRAWASAAVPDDFHATHHAREREYRYYLYAPTTPERALLGRGAFDDERALAALECLAGRHDCHNLTPDETGTVRTLRTSAERDGDCLIVSLRAGGFARQLVRRAVGLVAAVGRGDSSLDRVERALSERPLDGAAGVAPARPEPLVLWDVAYNVRFDVDEEAAASAREVFAGLRAERAAAARVAGSLADSIE